MSSFRRLSGEYTDAPYTRDKERIMSVKRRGHMMNDKRKKKTKKEQRSRELKKIMNKRFEREAFLSECAISSRAYYKKLNNEKNERRIG